MNPFRIGDLVQNNDVMQIERNGTKHIILANQNFIVIGIDGAIVKIKNTHDGSEFWVATKDIRHKSKHGGPRLGSGPKPRTDGRKLRPVKVPLNDNEFKMIKDLLTTDDRRKVLMDAIERIIV